MVRRLCSRGVEGNGWCLAAGPSSVATPELGWGHRWCGPSPAPESEWLRHSARPGSLHRESCSSRGPTLLLSFPAPPPQWRLASPALSCATRRPRPSGCAHRATPSPLPGTNPWGLSLSAQSPPEHLGLPSPGGGARGPGGFWGTAALFSGAPSRLSSLSGCWSRPQRPRALLLQPSCGGFPPLWRAEVSFQRSAGACANRPPRRWVCLCLWRGERPVYSSTFILPPPNFYFIPPPFWAPHSMWRSPAGDQS